MYCNKKRKDSLEPITLLLKVMGKTKVNIGLDTDPWRWVVVSSAFIVSLLTDGIRFSFGLIYKELLAAFSEGKGATAGIGSLMFGILNFTAPVASILINKFGCRCSVILGSIIFCIGLIASSLTPNFLFLYFSFGIVNGVGFALMYVPLSISVLQYFDKKKSLANGIAMCGSGVGGFVLNPLVNVLIDTYAWRGTLLMVAGIILQGAVAGALLRPPVVTVSKTDDNNVVNIVDEDGRGKNINGDSSTNSHYVNTDSKDKADNTNEDNLKQNVDDTCSDLCSHAKTCSDQIEINFKENAQTEEREDEYHLNSEETGTYKATKSRLIHLNEQCISQYKDDYNENDYLSRHPNELEISNKYSYAETDAPSQTIGTHSIVSPTTSQQKETSKDSEKTQQDINENPENTSNHKERKRPLFAWYILKDPRFILFLLNQLFLAFGYMIPFTYLPEIITSYGYSQTKAVWVMSAMSIVSSIFRVALGWVADVKFMNRRVLFCATNFVCAFAVSSLYLCRSYESIVLACIIYSMSSGCNVALVAVVVTDLFGSNLLSEAYGLCIFARGPGNILGPPLSGWVVDASGVLQLVFIVSGIAFLLSGLTAMMSVRSKHRLYA